MDIYAIIKQYPFQQKDINSWFEILLYVSNVHKAGRFCMFRLGWLRADGSGLL
jgi:hypothetical protein